MSHPQDEVVNNGGNLGSNKVHVIDELRAENDRLRLINSAQNIQLGHLQTRIQENSVDGGSQLVRTLIDGLRGLNVEAKIPRYCEPENSNHFIERLEKYFVLKNLQGNRLNLIDGCLDGRARVWFESQWSTLINYGWRVDLITHLIVCKLILCIKLKKLNILLHNMSLTNYIS